MKFYQQFLIRLALLPLLAFSADAGIVESVHNLSVSGPGTVKASSESQICIFCHTPHNSVPASPLWNRSSSGTTYTPYSSSTALASPGQPTGSSILCLSCHDGTIALGQVNSRTTPITMSGGITTLPSGTSRLGTDLSDDHPVSFHFTQTLASQRGELVSPSLLAGPVKLDKSGQMQCASCHDPHNNVNGKFLVMQNIASALCRTCHIKNYWNETSHSTSTNTWNGVLPDPWPHTEGVTVAANACENCHTPHNAGGHQRILNYSIEEVNCYVCHNGHVDSKNIEAEFNKTYRHPVSNTTGTHDPAESSLVNTNSRHVECADCHNPHAANATNPLNGVSGIDILGSEISQITKSHELCFRCHGNTAPATASRTTRVVNQTNTRLEFNTNNPSYHPVAGPGKSSDVPSLVPPLTTSSQISCVDCHNNNDTGGPRGPHGSIYAPLLKARFITGDSSESASNYALCYQCHNRTSILADAGFAKHYRHIVQVGTSCNTCHDPHGINYTQGSASNHSRLINFDRSIVTSNVSGILQFNYNADGSCSCSLSCHGRNHSDMSCSGGGGGGGGGGPGGG